MSRPRNNLSLLPLDTRMVAARLIVDGAAYASVRAEIAKLAPGVKIHNSTLLAYAKSAEFAEYQASRRQWDGKLLKRQWAARLINDGKGPQSLADMAELAILEQLHSLAESGLLETGKDVATVAKAITAMQRTQLARAESNLKSQISDLKSENEAERIALEQENDALRAEIATLKNDGRAVDPTAVADRMNAVLGVKKA